MSSQPPSHAFAKNAHAKDTSTEAVSARVEADSGSLSGPAGEIRVVDVRKLLGDGREIILMHLGEAYRLRITARERLILTK